MPVNQFSIQNVGAIRKAECSDVPDLMIIAGPNGVGKSTLFEQLTPNLSASRSTGKVQVDSVETTYPVYLSPHRAPAPGDIDASLLSSLGRESSRRRLGSSNYNITENEVPNVVRYTNSRDRKNADFATYFELKKRLAQLEFDRGQLFVDLYEEQGSIPEGAIPDFGEPLKRGIEAVLPGIEYDGVEQTEDREYNILFNDRSGNKVEFDDLSSGEKDAIALIFNLVEKRIEKLIESVRGEDPEREDLVVLIDSPEAYLHPAMQERFLEFVRGEIAKSKQIENSSSLQVFMCTHSQTIIQNVPDEYLYFLLYQDQREDNQLVSAEGISLDTLETITGELGVTALSSGNPLVLVEGKSDREVIRKLYPKKRDQLEILPIGGKGKVIEFSTAFNEIVPELYSKGIFLFAIVDRDRDLNINSEYAEFVHQLSTTCIENHLLNPDALFDALSMIASEEKMLAEEVKSASDVETLLQEIIKTSRFKEQEIKTRLNERLRFYIHIDSFDNITDEDHIRQQIDEVADTKKERVTEQIDSIQTEVSEAVENQNYSRLNGKYILSQISETFDLQADVLRRTTADMMASGNVQPASLTNALDHIMKTVEENSTPAALLDSVKKKSD